MAIPARLSEIAEQLKDGRSPSQETVRSFIGWFGARRRGYWIVRDIRTALESLKIQTKPDFDSVFIDSRISFTLDDTQTDPDPEATDSISGTDVDRNLDTNIPISGDANDPTYRIGKLESATCELLSVIPDFPISKAITLMLMHDYSQLPVMTNDRDVKGMISWKTIGSRLALGKSATLVGECMEVPQIVSASNSLFSVIAQIVKFDSVLVRGQDKTITGIVTTSDLSVQFRQLSEPFLLLEEIENHIRNVIDGHFDAVELSTVRDESDTTRNIDSVADLTFGEYIRLLENRSNWEKIGLNVDRVVFTKELDRIRKIRNDVVHFNADGISEDEQETLRRFVHFLQQLQVIVRSTG